MRPFHSAGLMTAPHASHSVSLAHSGTREQCWTDQSPHTRSPLSQSVSVRFIMNFDCVHSVRQCAYQQRLPAIFVSLRTGLSSVNSSAI